MIKLLLDISSIPNYIDPGTGSLVVQILIASLIGSLFMLKIYWKRIKTFFSRRGKDDK